MVGAEEAAPPVETLRSGGLLPKLISWAGRLIVYGLIVALVLAAYMIGTNENAPPRFFFGRSILIVLTSSIGSEYLFIRKTEFDQCPLSFADMGPR